jgi:hypothetical protein
MQIKFSDNPSDKVLATFTISVDELPNLEIGGGYVGHDKTGTKTVINLNPPMFKSAGIVSGSTEFTDGEQTVYLPSRAGKEAVDSLKTRIAKVWGLNQKAGVFGL